MKIRLLILGLLATLLTGCSLDDDRDECGIKIRFRYMVDNKDCFTRDVTTMRHFLFDSDSIYVREFISSCDYSEDLLIPDLEKGRYILITLGNMSDKTQLSELIPGQTKLREFSQGINSMQLGSFHSNGDELFYCSHEITVSANTPTYYLCDMSNIHCHLSVLATWDYTPSYHNNFTMRLYDVPASYSISPDSMRLVIQEYQAVRKTKAVYEDAELLFPNEPQSLTDHVVSVLPYNFELEGEFVTQRYTNQYVPILQIFNGEEPITGRINLDRAFTYFGWYPDNTSVQEYAIKLTIHKDGSVDLNRWIRGSVADWVDGGIITN